MTLVFLVVGLAGVAIFGRGLQLGHRYQWDQQNEAGQDEAVLGFLLFIAAIIGLLLEVAGYIG